MAKKVIKLPISDPAPRPWDLAQMIRALDSGSVRSHIATLKRAGILDSRGKLTGKYKNGHGGISRATDSVYLKPPR